VTTTGAGGPGTFDAHAGGGAVVVVVAAGTVVVGSTAVVVVGSGIVVVGSGTVVVVVVGPGSTVLTEVETGTVDVVLVVSVEGSADAAPADAPTRQLTRTRAATPRPARRGAGREAGHGVESMVIGREGLSGRRTRRRRMARRAFDVMANCGNRT
jgi:hypothetical protein